MRKLVVSTFVSLDGVMQAPGGPGEDFAHGGWSVNYWDEQMGQVMGEAVSRPFAMVLGRRIYDAHGVPHQGLRDEAVEKYHAIEGGQQTLSNLASYVTEIVQKGAEG